jgi:hypothetical protein
MAKQKNMYEVTVVGLGSEVVYAYSPKKALENYIYAPKEECKPFHNRYIKTAISDTQANAVVTLCGGATERKSYYTIY